MLRISIFSEVGKLKIVLLHRPGRELYNLLPSNDLVNELSIDDTVYLNRVIEEHDNFSKLLEKEGVNVLFLNKLIIDIIKDNNKKLNLIDKFIKITTNDIKLSEYLYDFFIKLSPEDLVMKMISGVIIDKPLFSQAGKQILEKNSLIFHSKPYPNLIFQRDPFFVAGNRNVFKANMFLKDRQQDTFFLQFVIENHAFFKKLKVNLFDNILKANDFIEGGDVLILNKKVIIISLTERTTISSVRKLKDKFFESGFETIVCLDLKDKNRTFMHLDTIFTNVYYDKTTVKFLVYPLIFENKKKFRIIEIKKTQKNQENVICDSFQLYLAQLLKKKIVFIHCGTKRKYKNTRIIDHLSISREQ
jgi:arginine deiminase